MRSKSIFVKALSLALTVAICVAFFAGCDDKKDHAVTTESNGGVTTPSNEYTGVLNDYKVVYQGYGAAALKDAAISFAKKLGLESVPDKSRDGEYEDNGGLEILVGNTTRAQSTTSLDALSASPSADKEYFYMIKVEDNARVSVVGNKPDAVSRALDLLLDEYIEKNGDSIVLNLSEGESVYGGYDYKLITASTGTTFDTVLTSTLYKPVLSQASYKAAQYPKVIELQHSGDKNGTLLATLEIFSKAKSGFYIYKSTDGGKTWNTQGRVTEKMDTSYTSHWEPHLFELPCQVGDMPEGTLLLSGTTVGGQRSHITVWRSYDSGLRWEQYTEITTGGGTVDAMPSDSTYHGVWEPCIIYEDGYLYCFYSDDSDALHDQKLSYKRSADGVNWEEQVDVVCFEEYHWRPGMISLTKMGNGKYFAPYEICSNEVGGCDVYFKIVDDISSLDSWDPTDHGTKLKSVTKGAPNTIGSAPWSGWTPAGGDCGTLFVSAAVGGDKYLYVSFDYGKTFETIENPLPSTREASYSSSFFFTSDGSTLYYANTVALNDDFGMIEFAKIFIKEGRKDN